MALQALLGFAGYCAQFLREPALEEAGLGERLAESRLLIIAPDLSAEYRRALLGTMGTALPANVPVLELLPVNAEQPRFGGSTVHWPCSMEELGRAIAAALAVQR